MGLIHGFAWLAERFITLTDKATSGLVTYGPSLEAGIWEVCGVCSWINLFAWDPVAVTETCRKKLSRVEDVTFIERLCLKRSKHGIDPSRCLRIHSGHIFWHVQERIRFQTSMNNLTSQDQFTYSSVYGWLAQTNTMNLNIQPPWDALNEKI